MRLPTYPVFGQSNSTAIVPASFNGQPNWFYAPPGYSLWTDSDGVQWCSPNADRSDPKYVVKTNIDGSCVFQSLIHSEYMGTLRGS